MASSRKSDLERRSNRLTLYLTGAEMTERKPKREKSTGSSPSMRATRLSRKTKAMM
ncbi:MAG: hypothetical protein OEU92_05230 [Alphaproteobacteria bacterium]|nr:hypothetical protein [Alphaproteobacteria bacterium]